MVRSTGPCAVIEQAPLALPPNLHFKVLEENVGLEVVDGLIDDVKFVGGIWPRMSAWRTLQGCRVALGAFWSLSEPASEPGRGADPDELSGRKGTSAKLATAFTLSLGNWLWYACAAV